MVWDTLIRWIMDDPIYVRHALVLMDGPIYVRHAGEWWVTQYHGWLYMDDNIMDGPIYVRHAGELPNVWASRYCGWPRVNYYYVGEFYASFDYYYVGEFDHSFEIILHQFVMFVSKIPHLLVSFSQLAFILKGRRKPHPGRWLVSRQLVFAQSVKAAVNFSMT